MSPKTERFTAKKIIKIIEMRGFILARQNGSHIIFYHKSGLRVTVPNHNSKIIHPKIIKNILRDIENV